MKQSFRYKAFISYSHKDRRWGQWLLKALESYKIPKHLVGKKTKKGNVPTRLLPIFRDRDELPIAEDLTIQIQEALINSEFLIVVCSPNAVGSNWVNKEIEVFKRHRGRKNILCVIAAGELNVSTSKTPPTILECFPKALIKQKGGRIELVAADLRVGGDGKRLALLKLVAGMIGVGLDEIIRRDLQRRNRRVTAITLASVVSMLIMGSLMLIAIRAEQEAEQKRMEAEGLIEFMLTDLRDKLEDVGRLDVLDTVGNEVVNYYAAQKLNDLSKDSLGRRSRAFHLLGEIDDLQGNLEEAQAKFSEASETTQTLLDQDSNNPKRIFEHAQSVYWVGYLAWKRNDYGNAEIAFTTYKNLADKLVSLDEENPAWQLEVTYANSNLGTLYLRNLDKPKKALEIYKNLLSQSIKLFGETPTDPKKTLDLVNTYGWLADAAKIASNLSEAEKYRKEQIILLDGLLEENSDNISAKGEEVTAQLGLARIEMAQGESLYAVNRLKLLVDKSEGLIAYDPSNANWLRRAARHYLYLTEAYLLLGLLDEAEQSLDRSQQLIKEYETRTKMHFREKVQLTYLYQLLRVKISYLFSELTLSREISKALIQNLTKEMGEGARTADAYQILAEAFLLSGLTALEVGDETTARAEWQALVYLLEPRVEIESPDTLEILSKAYSYLGEVAKAKALEKALEARGYKKQNIYPDN